ncbi:hypothetical protein PG985_012065 [Apiospora marii]|uniref:uncharacterized protein n=1 Tax=Apiospora marii TaxID=335849 RepID=UPI00313007FF
MNMNSISDAGTRFARRAQDDTYTREKRAIAEVRADECRLYFQGFDQFAQQEVLNVGGFGVVVKYAQADAQGRVLRHFVVKIPREYDNTDGERNILMFQREYVWNVIERTGGRGSVSHDSNSGKTHVEDIPMSMLAYLLSVTRACIGLAWPRLTADEATEMALSGEIPRIPETTEEIGPTAPVSIVHFDFDPSNVIIGDFQDNAPEHSLQPVFKLGDFGLTQEVTSQTTVDELNEWQNGGKHGYRAPEQMIGRELGKRGLFTPDLLTYGPHTNIWGMGVTMFALITKTKPPRIPQFASYTCTLQGQDADTYGWFLTQTEENRPVGAASIYATYPEELRHLVARCMAAETLQRPTLGYLLPVIQQHIAQGDELERQGRSPFGESDAHIERFCREYIVGAASATGASTREDDAEEEEARDVLGDLGFPGGQVAARAARRSQSRSRGGGGGGGGGSSQRQDSRFWGQGGGSVGAQSVSQAYAEAESQLLAQQQEMQRRQSSTENTVILGNTMNMGNNMAMGNNMYSNNNNNNNLFGPGGAIFGGGNVDPANSSFSYGPQGGAGGSSQQQDSRFWGQGNNGAGG